MIRRRKRRFLILVGAALVVPALLLSLLGLKLLLDFTEITQTVRSDYGEYMARIASASVEDAFWEQEQLNMVSARLVPPENPDQVVGFLNRFQRENPIYLEAFFVSPVGLVYYSGIATDRGGAYRPLPDWVLNPIFASLERHLQTPSSLYHLAAPDSLPAAEVTYFTVHSDSGELLGAAGFFWDLDRVKEDHAFLDRALVTRLNANPDVFQGFFFRSPVAVTLLDEDGTPFYTTVPDAGDRYIARRSFSRVLRFYQVGVQLSDDRFDSWVRRVMVTNLAIILAMFGVIVFAVAFALRFILHEMALADLKSTFVSNVSHELKTPLALIRLFSETLEMGRVADREKEKEFLRVIGKESERLTHLIDNVLDVGRIEQGRKTYRMRPTDLGRVVRETLAAYEFQLKEKGFRVETAIAEDLPVVNADPDALIQALINLLDNSIKYSRERKVMRIGLREEDGHAVISVEDQGVGIPPREQDKIFEEFYRVERGLVHTVKGSGLGLSLVKHIVEAHGGRVRVESRPGEGSRFSIFLPLEGTSPPGDLDAGDGGGTES